jgi:hypothetical protein
MDVNDITSRLEIILTALDSRIDDNYKSHIKIEFNGEAVTSILPGKDDKPTIEFKILSILHLLATPKDHLKKRLEKNGDDPKVVERVIDSSIHLKVLIDLVNADKHGYPTKSNRSKKNPVIKNASQGLRNNNDGKPIVVMMSPNGELETVHGKPPSVVLSAGIFDDKKNFLFDLDTLVETSYYHWVTIAKMYNCI